MAKLEIDVVANWTTDDHAAEMVDWAIEYAGASPLVTARVGSSPVSASELVIFDGPRVDLEAIARFHYVECGGEDAAWALEQVEDSDWSPSGVV